VTVWGLLHRLNDTVVLGAAVHLVDLFHVDVREPGTDSDQVREVGVDGLHGHLATSERGFSVVHDGSVIVWRTPGINSVSGLFFEVVLNMVGDVLPSDFDEGVAIRARLLVVQSNGVADFVNDGGPAPASGGEGHCVLTASHSDRGRASASSLEVDVSALVIASGNEPQTSEFVVVGECSLEGSFGFCASSDGPVHGVWDGDTVPAFCPQSSSDGSESKLAIHGFGLLSGIQNHVTLEEPVVFHLVHPETLDGVHSASNQQ